MPRPACARAGQATSRWEEGTDLNPVTHTGQQIRHEITCNYQEGNDILDFIHRA